MKAKSSDLCLMLKRKCQKRDVKGGASVKMPVGEGALGCCEQSRSGLAASSRVRRWAFNRREPWGRLSFLRALHRTFSRELNLIWRRGFINWALGEGLEATMVAGWLTHVVTPSVMEGSGVYGGCAGALLWPGRT